MNVRAEERVHYIQPGVANENTKHNSQFDVSAPPEKNERERYDSDDNGNNSYNNPISTRVHIHE